MNEKTNELPEMKASIDMDAVDWRILDQLQIDASLSNLDLAAATHTSPATCLRRVKRLVTTGVIERRIAILSAQKLGTGLTGVWDHHNSAHRDQPANVLWPVNELLLQPYEN